MRQTARSAALDALLQMEKNEGYSNLVIDKALKAAELDRRDGALCSTLFYGVLEKRLTLDWLLEQCLRDPKKKLDRTVRMALRCGAYQIFFLDRIPDSAAVNETVNAVKNRGKGVYAGFVNGVLRNLIRKKDSLSLPEGDGLAALSLRYSVPEGLISLWRRAYGEENAKKLLEAFGEKPELYLRLNPLKPASQTLDRALAQRGIVLERFRSPTQTAVIRGGGSPAALPEFQEGLFHVQDLSAQAACEILSPQPGETVYDCCAAPGGKTFTLAEMMENRGSVTSFDLYPGRARLIAEGAGRLGIGCVTAKALDMTKLPEGFPPGDRVLCDAPCSGFGVIRRKPEIRYKDLRTLKELPELQYAILQNAARLVKPGGVLLYTTCTLNPAENGEVAERFLKENGGFLPRRIDPPWIVPANGEEPLLRRWLDEPEHQFTMAPFAGASDGFFAAAFVKRAG